MRLSEFRNLVDDEFGHEYGQVITRDLVLTSLQDQTATLAIAAGVDPREVWLAICHAADVPKERWHGKLKPNKPKAD